MRHYSEFLSTVSLDDQVIAQNKMNNSLKELNSVPTILCRSTNSHDSDALLEVIATSETTGEEHWY